MVELGQELSFNDRPHLCLFAHVGDFSGTIKQVHPLARGSYLLDVEEEAYTHMPGCVVEGEHQNDDSLDCV